MAAHDQVKVSSVSYSISNKANFLARFKPKRNESFLINIPLFICDVFNDWIRQSLLSSNHIHDNGFDVIFPSHDSLFRDS